MHFVILGHMDPMDEAFWSGIPRNISQHLRDAGHRVTTIGPLEPQVTMWARIKFRFYRHVLGLVYLINRDPTVSRCRALNAMRLLGQLEDVDAVIVVALSDAAFLDVTQPIILVHDATWRQLLDFYPGYERNKLAKETLEGAEEMELLSLKKCGAAIYASKWAARSAVEHYGLTPTKVTTLPFGAGLTPTPERERLIERLERYHHDKPMRLLFVGVEWHRKGGDIAVEIAGRIASRRLPVELQVVGCQPPIEQPAFVRCFGFLSKRDPVQNALIGNPPAG